jgi:putative oxidoreductase
MDIQAASFGRTESGKGQKYMTIPQLLLYADVALLLLRLMVGVVFVSSGWNDLKDPAGRSKDIGMSKGFTIFLGAAEIVLVR